MNDKIKMKDALQKGKGCLLDTWRFLVQTFGEEKKLYIGFVFVVTLCCISMAEIAQGNDFRSWYYNLVNKNVVGKGMEYANEASDEVVLQNYGSFLTHYYFRDFGEITQHKVEANMPMVALTFDDGPNPEYTGRILDALATNDARATFFVVGTNAESYPQTLRAIAMSGNEIGNHTYSHANLTKLDSSQVEQEVDKVNRAVKAATGDIATVIRPPYGAYNGSVLEQLEQPVVLWDLDTEDWDSRDAQTIVDNIIGNLDDGDIILMHDIYASTAEAVELLLPRLKEMGYEVVSVSEMAEYKGKELELHKAYGGVK